jgi:hypothetical protein
MIPQTTAAYHLTPEQLQFFDDFGYLILRNWIPDRLLQKLQAAGSSWIEQGWNVQADSPDFTDYRFAERPNGRVMYRVDYLHNKGIPASLELLGSPYVLGVAESMCGRNFVPTYESMVFKQEGDGEAIPWHQDAVHPRKWRIFNYDLYLDASRIGGGALRVIPGSSHQKHDVCQVADIYGWNHPEAIDVEMEPGDVLLHDVMVLHGSERVQGKALRRTIYYEFRAAEEILEDGPWDSDWIDKRLRLVPIGLSNYAQAAELKIAHLVHMPGSYCSAGSAG